MHVDTDLLIIGGGSAGCMAAIAARAHAPTVAVTLLEKGGPFRGIMKMLRSGVHQDIPDVCNSWSSIGMEIFRWNSRNWPE